jgi:N-acyl-D-aspartate/D-glutamate deacylase
VSTFDVIIRDGEVIDGTGAAARRADVAIADGKVAEIGEVEGSAHRVIDAEGLVVAPGIVDIHTHYDAQVLWDPACTPSSLHGVTTVISGNCGFTIAPVEPTETDYLARMLSHVEGIPLDALQAGVDFQWRSFGDYLNRLDGNLGINMGLLVGHSALRRVVMGGEAVGGTPTAAQLGQMQALLGRSLAAGGLGFSSSQSKTHNDGDGNPVPSRYAAPDELVALASVVGEHPGTTLEFIPGVTPFTDQSYDLMADMCLAAGRPLNWNVISVAPGRRAMIEGMLASHERVWAKGAEIVPLTMPASPTLFINLKNGYALLDPLPGWSSFMALPLDEKTRLLSDPAQRNRLNGLAHSPEAGMLADAIAGWAIYTVNETFTPANRQFEGRTVGEIAAERGQDPFDCMVEIALADELRTIFCIRGRGDDDESWEMRRELWSNPRLVIGASDAGAHLDTVVTFTYATNMIANARDRGLLPLEEVMRLLTDVPARFYGLRGRGRLAKGYQADVYIFDRERLACGPITWREDMPAGAGRLYAEAEGVAHLLVNGTEVVRGQELTGALPGSLLRSGRDTETVAPGSRLGSSS